MRCKKCQYPLKALTEHRCPECGRVFDPADHSTFDPNPSFFDLPRAYAFVLFFVIPIALAFAWGLYDAWNDAFQPDTWPVSALLQNALTDIGKRYLWLCLGMIALYFTGRFALLVLTRRHRTHADTTNEDC